MGLLGNKFDRFTVTAYVKGVKVKERARDVFRRKEGEGFVDTAIFS